MDIPTGLEHIKLIGKMGDKNRLITSKIIAAHKEELELLGISLSMIYQVSTCHRKCFGGSHVLEGLAGRFYNLACSSYFLTCRGLYDEALNLVRSMGEISNLIAMSIEDQNAFERWLNADKNTRIREFAPNKVRKMLKDAKSEVFYVKGDWYSKFCEDFTHVTPSTQPNVHNDKKQAFTGGVVQENGLEFAINEIFNLTANTAIMMVRLRGQDGMLQELLSATKRIVDES
jgi:hypothetical protein